MRNLALCLLVAVALVPAAASPAGWQMVFSDDFNRPNGPLGDPWVLQGDSLFIQSNYVVGDAYTYGLAAYTHSEGGPSIALEADFNFRGTPDGWVHFWIAGASPSDTVAYGAEMDWQSFGLYFYPPEMLLDEKPFAFVLDHTYTMRLAYDHLTGIASLAIRDRLGVQYDSIGVAGPGLDFTMIYAGLENEASLAKFFDNVVFWQKPTSGTQVVPGPCLADVSLASPYPKPCTRQAVIGYSLARTADVSLTMYDVAGRVVRFWRHPEAGPGCYDLYWDLRSAEGKPVSSGLYLCTIEACGRSETRRVVVIK